MLLRKILLSASIFLSIQAFAQDLKLELQITQLISDEGKIMMQLFQTNDSGEQIVHSEYYGRISNKQCVMEISSLQPGEYGVKYFHDIDNNGQLDTNFMGVPEEGFGFSKNPPINFGAPEYKNWKFNLETDQVLVLRTVNF